MDMLQRIEFYDEITKYQSVPYSNESISYTTAQPVFWRH